MESDLFIIENHSDLYRVVKKKNEKGEFRPEYLFSEQARNLDEYADMCIYHQTRPESHFTQNKICSMATESGRITSGNTLKITENGSLHESVISDKEIPETLWKYFNIKF